jgi:hypothetical protein
MPTLNELWTVLRADTPAGADGISLRMRSEAVGVRLYAGLECSSGLPSILLEIARDSKPKEWSRVSTRAFDAQTVKFAGLPSGRIALSVKLNDRKFEDLFLLLGEDIVQAVEAAANEGAAIHSVVRRIERWRKFLERGKKHLTDEEVRGLLGELAVLGRCISHHGAKTSLDAWQHDGGLRDFEFPFMVVEVKTYQAATGASIRIGDPAQLDPAAGRPLYLATIQLSLVENSGWSLPLAINRVNDLLAGDIEAGERYWDLLAAQGYLPAHAGQYTERYLISPVESCLVSDGFPRIGSATIPLGVEDVAFSIRLAALWRFRVPAEDFLGAESPLE